MTPKHVLIVEDDPKTTHLLSTYLSHAGLVVQTASDGSAGLALSRTHAFDVIILDLMLPSIDGLTVCRAIREVADPRIIMLTARSTERDILIGLEAGADDYVTKPFSPRELVARVRATLRRVPESNEPDEAADLTVGDLVLSVRSQTVTQGGTDLHLTALEFRLLALLMGSPGQVFTRTQIVVRVLGENYDGFDRSIDVHILKLRRKLSMDTGREHYIETVYGVGYRLVNGSV
ncbi:MAG: response regulator transcription factor [Alkalispirochaeta sp.]